MLDIGMLGLNTQTYLPYFAWSNFDLQLIQTKILNYNATVLAFLNKIFNPLRQFSRTTVGLMFFLIS